MNRDLSAARVFAHVALEIGTTEALTSARLIAVQRAGEVLGCGSALLVEERPDGRLGCLAATDDHDAQELSGIIRTTRDGPFRCALDDVAATVHVTKLESDGRWALFRRHAMAQTSIRSGAYVRLQVGEERLGVLGLFSERSEHFDAQAVDALDLLGAHIALALARVTSRSNAAHLRVALDSNREIAMAIGIIMNNRKLDQPRAFDLLRAVSQHQHTKLRELAASIVLTGEIPEAEHVRRAPAKLMPSGAPT
ncbi:MAG TPA: GAF and ANTAR domain-containing protein [Jatrophihabitans sp.]